MTIVRVMTRTAIGVLLLTAAALWTPAQTKNQTPEEREEFFRQEIPKAKWLFLGKDSDDIPYYVDSSNMHRVMSVVTFIIKFEKRGTIEYDKVVGGCTKDLIAVSITMVSNPGVKDLIGKEIKDPEYNTVSKGDIGYSMLDYVCKNAEVIKVDGN